MNYYCDTHVHLNDDKLYERLDEVINNALSNDVKLMFVVGWDLPSSYKAIELAEQYDFIYAIVGFHPCNIRGYSDIEYNELDKLCKNTKVVAVGEIGYDLHWDDTTLEEQTIAFERQIEIAKKHHLPVSIHAREADQLTFDLLKRMHIEEIGGVLHCFSGSLELAKEYLKLNMIFGFGGTITFKNNKVGVRCVEGLPIDAILTETDSPYLAPTPHRGEINEPKYIPLVVDKISELKNIPVEGIKSKILDNVKRVFGVNL